MSGGVPHQNHPTHLDVRQASYRGTYWKETPGSFVTRCACSNDTFPCTTHTPERVRALFSFFFGSPDNNRKHPLFGTMFADEPFNNILFCFVFPIDAHLSRFSVCPHHLILSSWVRKK